MTTILDATASVWLENQLLEREAEAVRKIRPMLTAERFFPVKVNDFPLADAISFPVITAAGKAKIKSGRTGDRPTLDLSRNEVPFPVKQIEIAFGIEDLDVQRAMKLGITYESDYVDEAMAAVRTEINGIAWNGNEEFGLPGLLVAADSGVTAHSPTHGSWASNIASHPEYVRDDIAKAWAAWQNACAYNFPLTHIGMAPDEYAILATTVNSSYTDMTALAWIRSQLGFMAGVEIMPVPELADVPTDGNHMLMISKDPSNAALRIPLDVTYSPIADGRRIGGYDVVCYARCGGLHVKKPLSMYLVKGL